MQRLSGSAEGTYVIIVRCLITSLLHVKPTFFSSCQFVSSDLAARIYNIVSPLPSFLGLMSWSPALAVQHELTYLS